jgi:hypothetical protein
MGSIRIAVSYQDWVTLVARKADLSVAARSENGQRPGVRVQLEYLSTT